MNVGKLNCKFENKISANANCLVAAISFVLTRLETGFELVIKDEKMSPPKITNFSDSWNPISVDELQGFLCSSLGFTCDKEVKSAIEDVYRLVEEMLFEYLGKTKSTAAEAFDSERINTTSMTLETLYMGMLTSDDIDESLFVRSSKVSLE